VPSLFRDGTPWALEDMDNMDRMDGVDPMDGRADAGSPFFDFSTSPFFDACIQGYMI
jgi:hypothetical protein